MWVYDHKEKKNIVFVLVLQKENDWNEKTQSAIIRTVRKQRRGIWCEDTSDRFFEGKCISEYPGAVDSYDAGAASEPFV